MKRIYQYTEYLVVLGAMKLLSCCGRGFFFFIAPPLARLLFLFPQFHVAVQNVKTAFPEKSPEEQKRIAVKSLENLILSLCEFFWSKGQSEKILQDLIDYPEESEETGRIAHQHESDGVIFVTPHHGNWEFAGMVMALHYHFKAGTVVRTARNPYLDKLISSGRMVKGVRIIHSKGAVRGMVNALREGYAIGTLIDQNVRARDGGIFVTFFGLPVPVSRAPASMARKANHFMASGVVVREGRRFKTLLRPLPKPTSEYASDEELTQALMTIAEEFIRAYPEQYLWMYKRFQYIPRGTDAETRKKFPPYAVDAPPKFYEKKYARGTPPSEPEPLEKAEKK